MKKYPFGRRCGTNTLWQLAVSAARGAQIAWRTDVAIARGPGGALVLVIGASSLAGVEVIEALPRYDMTGMLPGDQGKRAERVAQMRMFGFNLYLMATPRRVGRPRTTPLPDPHPADQESPALLPEDGPVYSPEQQAALRRELGLED